MYTLKVVKMFEGWNAGDAIEAPEERAKELVNLGVAIIVGGESVIPAFVVKTEEPVVKVKARKKGVK